MSLQKINKLNKIFKWLFFVFVCLSLTAPIWVSKDFLFPFVTTKAFFFRFFIELALPFYVYFLVTDSRLRPSIKNLLNWAVLAFVIINFISAFLGVDVQKSLWGNFERMGGAYYIAHLAALYFYAVMFGQMQGWYLPKFLQFLLGVGAVVSINGIFGWLKLPTLVLDPSLPGRVSSTLGNPIYVGSFLIIPMFLALFFAHQTESLPKRIGYYFLAFISLAGIFLSGTRGAVVGLLIGGFVAAVIYLFLTKNKQIKSYGLILVAVLVVAAGLLFNFSAKLPEGSLLQRVFHLRDSNASSRLLQWKVALKGYPERPWLGTGAENYSIVANKYYNPEIYKYDSSWFDKPHNYWLEILVTNGLFGFITYLLMIALLFRGFYLGFKAELYGLMEFCLLIAASLAYQVQNLFVFDTVPASLMFFAFAGFAGFIFQAVHGAATQPNKKLPANLSNGNVSQAFGLTVFIFCVLVMIYGEYATNILPLSAAKYVNYGFAYAGVDPKIALDYFEKAINTPFNFDTAETAGKFADFASGLVRNQAGVAPDLLMKAIKESSDYLEQVTYQRGNNPVLWQRLASAYLLTSAQQDGRLILNPKAEQAINKAIELVPSRNEAYLTLSQIKALEGSFGEAEKILIQAKKNLPTDKTAVVQLATIYRTEGKTDKAAAEMESILGNGYSYGSYAEMKWLIDYYADKKNFDKAVKLQLEAAKLEPNNVIIFEDLARLYIKAGQFDVAKNLIQNLINLAPSTKQDMQPILESLNSSASVESTVKLEKK